MFFSLYEDEGYFPGLKVALQLPEPLGVSSMSRLALSRLTSQSLTSRQALQLAADFAFTADYLRAAEPDDLQNHDLQNHDLQNHVQTMAKLYETASRTVFLRAHVIARDEEMRPAIGESFRRAVFAVA